MKKIILVLFVWTISMFTAVFGQTSVINVSDDNDTCFMLINYAPSEYKITEEDMLFITSMLADFNVVVQHSWADLAPNRNGMSNDTLAKYRNMEIAAITNVEGRGHVANFISSNMRFTQIVFVRKSARTVTEEVNVQAPVTIDTTTNSVSESISRVPSSTQEIDSLARAAYFASFTPYESAMAEMEVPAEWKNTTDTIATHSTDSVYFCDCRDMSVDELADYSRDMRKLSLDKSQPIEIQEAAALCAMQSQRFMKQEITDAKAKPNRKAKRDGKAKDTGYNQGKVRGNGIAHMSFGKWFNMRTGLCMF